MKHSLQLRETEPSFLTDETVVPVATYNHSQCLELMETNFWNNPAPE